jgi:hypothetical protein
MRRKLQIHVLVVINLVAALLGNVAVIAEEPASALNSIEHHPTTLDPGPRWCRHIHDHKRGQCAGGHD